MRKAFILSLDALAAVGLLFILTGFLASLSVSYSSPELRYQRLYYAGKDVMNVMERVKLSAVTDFMPANYTSECNITSYDMDKTVLDVLGYLWAQNSTTLNQCASNLTEMILNMTLGPDFGYEVILGGTNISSRGEEGNYLSRLHTIVSGYELGKPVSGYMASAYVARMSRSTFSNFYFGGYEGDGNITKVIALPDDANVTNAYLEANLGSNFSIYINGAKIGDYISSPQNFTAGNWTLCSGFTACSLYFETGDNYLSINFSSFRNSYVGGGFLKVSYNTSRPDTSGVFSISNETHENTYWFPGIKGLINLFSSFYVPGGLSNMTLYLHYRNNITINDSGLPIYLYIGNTEVLRSNQSGQVSISRNDTELHSLLDYANLSNATTPIRLGMETFRIIGGVGSSDTGLVTDRSTSMADCRVAANQAPYNCGGCSVTCDDFESACTDVCGGSWVPLGGGVYHCINEVQYCNSTSSLCTQCAGSWNAMSYKINVARDTDREFVNTIMNVSGSRIGLASYGYDLCSSDELTYSNQSLQGSISGYLSDCGYTCTCCGINKAADMLVKGVYINPLNNSEFAGPSTSGWAAIGSGNLSQNSTVLNQLVFDGTGLYPDTVHVNGTVYAIAYTGPNNDGWLKTVNISNNGTIAPLAISQYEFDTSDGGYPSIIHVAGNIYAIAYTGQGDDGWLKTVNISSNGIIVQSTISQYEFDTSNGLYPKIIRVAGNIYAIAYTGPNNDGWLKTVTISNTGVITQSTADQLEFDTSNGVFPDIIHVAGNTYAIAYTGPDSDGGGNDDGWLKTVSISNAGDISNTVTDSFDFDGLNGQNPNIIHISGNVYAIGYSGNGNHGWILTVDISDAGAIQDTLIDSFEFDAVRAMYIDMIPMNGSLFAVAYSGPGNDGWLNVLKIGNDGSITYKAADTVYFQNADIRYPGVINISENVYAIAYEYDSNDDGYIKTIRLGGSGYGLYDYWYASSDYTTYGALKQNFTVPTGTIINSTLRITHSTNDSFFDGTASPYCNLTYPGGNVTVVTVWSASWNAANNPAGPVTEEFDIKPYLTDRYFTYTLECGTNVTPGGGKTIVAFDDIMINMTMSRYRATLVMSDGLANYRCDGFRDYAGTSDNTYSDDWAINSSCHARDNGIVVYSVAFGTDADKTTMKKIACWNCTTNNWIEGEGMDNCSRYYESNNADELKEIYREIAGQIGSASFEVQTVNLTGNISLENVLYPDSYLRFNYIPQTILGYGEVSIAMESERFGGSVTSPKNGTFYVPGNSRILYADALSYSSEFWTSSVTVNSSKTSSPRMVYNISNFGSNYINIGDPFIVHLPAYLISSGANNSVSVDTELRAGVKRGGSPFDRVIYHVGVAGLVGYGEVFPTKSNATDDAKNRLGSQLSGFNITMLEVETPSQYISEMPSLWGPSVMEIRIWK